MQYKSCTYCRHRKKRCLFPSPGSGDGRCFACQHLGVECQFEARQPSQKRRRTSQRVARRVYADTSNTTDDHNVNINSSPTTTSGNGDCQIPEPGTRKAKKLLLPLPGSTPPTSLTSRQLYQIYVQSDFPFVPQKCFLDGFSEVLDVSVRIAAHLSFRFRVDQTYRVRLDALQQRVTGYGASERDLAGLLLILPRMSLMPEVQSPVRTTARLLSNRQHG
jgi:hypothetical protein